MQYVAVGQSPFVDASVAVGPYRTYERARLESEKLDHKGYVTEVVELSQVDEIPNVTNEEGS